MQVDHNNCNVLFDIIDIFTNDKIEENISLLLQKVGYALNLGSVFIAKRTDIGEYVIANSWADSSDFDYNIHYLLNKSFDDTCISIVKDEYTILVYNMKVRGMTPVSVGFVKNSEFSWDNYERGVLRSLCKLLKNHFMRTNIPISDPLTGMPCLTDFAYEIEKRQGQFSNRYAVVYSDILGFKNINDIYGHEFGDKIIKYIAEVIKKSSRQDEFYCRVTADKFISVMRYESNEAILHTLKRTTRVIKKKFPEFSLTNCKWKSGVYVLKGSESYAMQSIDNANYALKIAKSMDSGYAVFYDDELEEKISKNRYFVSNMKKAMENEEFNVYFQPLVDLNTNRMIGSEALVRWIKDGKVIPPSEFIPLFEENNFMSELDFYIYEKVCQQLTQWLKRSYPVYPVSVNISRLHLKEQDFIERFIQLIDKYNLPHNLLELEITENIFINNMEDAIKFIQNLKVHGFVCAIDDFGSGFSSLNILRYLPVDILKLDKEFLNEDVNFHINQQIVYHTIKLAKSLNMRVLAEGVENEKQLQYLQKCGCDMVQGFLYARPMTVEEFTDLIKTY